MNVFIQGQAGASALLFLLVFVNSTAGQELGEKCLAKFRQGKDDFVLDADGSVKDGATFLSAPKLERDRDCLTACCKQPRCNVAFMERGDEEGLIQSCFLFDCLYKQKYACRFVRKKGFINYIMESIYERYRDGNATPNETDNPPVANAGPDRVVQPHDSVTLNGIQSTDDNEIGSYNWQIIGDYPYVLIEKTTFADQIIVSNLTSGTYKFQLTVTDNIGQSDSTTITVMVLTQAQSEHHCMVPVKPGPCRGSYPRWHYNAASGKCEKFSYGGCKPNLNNYLSEEECTNACDGTEKSGGTSRGLLIPSEEKCGVECTAEQFSCANGCCLDAGLECDSVEQCGDGSDEHKCDYLNKKFRFLLAIPLDENKVRCTETPDTGNCRETYSKWYYDPFSQKCIRFNYGGCGGNENRFDDQETCKNFCRNVTEGDVFLRKEEIERSVSDSHTGIVAIAVLLGLCILILLILLGYFYMKGRRSKQHQRVPINAPVTTSAGRERLVYNSTTKPI
ncbi:kunitz-type protease inhibitor 1a [Melanotaenia boesemani]|uniref:kunitz-type protease inhibitor 1a n=1 Tax=Melanotaenia boesemani TaxID=1250792 RepID=UPI001C03D5C1|nr:kunitz-type protease inhibitor 1a [Melanotaenia boesemani]